MYLSTRTSAQHLNPNRTTPVVKVPRWSLPPTAKQQFKERGPKYIPTGDFQHLQHPFCQVCSSLKLRDRQPRAPDDTEARRQGNPMFARKQKLQGSRRQAGREGGLRGSARWDQKLKTQLLSSSRLMKATTLQYTSGSTQPSSELFGYLAGGLLVPLQLAGVSTPYTSIALASWSRASPLPYSQPYQCMCAWRLYGSVHT